MGEVKEAFPARVQKLWNSMELRVLVLLSLFLQVVLITAGNRRKYIRKKWIGAILWVCYLGADVVATIALGVLSRSSDAKSSEPKEKYRYAIMGFWAPFLLMHLGGPDSITSYALADNELWSRHLLELIGQVSIAIYVLVRSWMSTPVTYLWFVIFAAGFLKYGERSLVQYWASRDQFRKWMVSPPDPGPNYAKLMDEYVSKEREGFVVRLGKVIDTVPSTIGLIASSSTSLDPPVPDIAPGVTEHATFVQDVYPFFLTFRKLFTDLILTFQDSETSLSYFRALTWDKAFGIVEIELGLIYDLFYTKALLLYSTWGFCIRLLNWLSTIAALVAFVIIDKNDYPETEVIITYILLAVAILIEIYAVIIFLLSDWFMIWSTEDSTSLPGLPVWEGFRRAFGILVWVPRRILVALISLPRLVTFFRRTSRLPRSTFEGQNSPPRFEDHTLSRHSFLLPARLRWSNGMDQYNVLDRCIRPKPNKIRKFLKKYLVWSGKSVPKGLKAVIFDELKTRVGGTDDDKKLGGYRGDKSLLQETGKFGNVDEVEFDQSVLLWHLATDLCYHNDVDEGNKPQETWLYEFIINGESSSEDILKFKREISVLLSNYMVHLLIDSPFMLPSGIGQIRVQDTRAEAREFFDGLKNIRASKACEMLLKVDTRSRPSKVKGDRSKSLLFDACRLAQSLRLRKVDDRWEEISQGERWEKITQAWLYILTFAAAQCKWSDHAEKLSQGGELLTHVWLLMAHFGMTDHFQISQGYERVKLNSK